MVSERDRIKKKIQKINPNKWKSDNFDVRYYLISQLKKHEEKSVLDVGGGDGIILSELNQNAFRVNLDLSLKDLKNCIKNVDSKINPICASITYFPFKKEIFDLVICSHVIELTKLMDINNKVEDEKNKNVLTLVNEIHRVLNNPGKLFITTPNFAFRNSPNKLTFSELNTVLSKFFQDFKIYFFNTMPKIKSNSKFDFSNVVPKLWSKFSNPDQIINSLLKEKSNNNYSVYFYAYARKN